MLSIYRPFVPEFTSPFKLPVIMIQHSSCVGRLSYFRMGNRCIMFIYRSRRRDISIHAAYVSCKLPPTARTWEGGGYCSWRKNDIIFEHIWLPLSSLTTSGLGGLFCMQKCFCETLVCCSSFNAPPPTWLDLPTLGSFWDIGPFMPANNNRSNIELNFSKNIHQNMKEPLQLPRPCLEAYP